MAKYTVRFYKGDYASRQQTANFDRAVCYVEQHFSNSGGGDANYSLATIASNAPSPAEEWGRWYTATVSRQFDIPDNGVSVGGSMGRMNDHLRHADMPGVLLEPCFISNPMGAKIAAESTEALAQILADSILKFFPNGGLIAFSVGHKFTPNPNDVGGRTANGQSEAELAEQVMLTAKALLENAVSEETVKPIEASPSVYNFILPAHIARKVDIEKKLEAEAQSRLVTPPSEESVGVDDATAARLWVIDQGISDGRRPKDPVTREEIWQMLYKALGE